MIKLTFEYIQNYFKQRQCTLLETCYINNNTKMQYICKCGNKLITTWKSFPQLVCKKCKNITTFNYVKNYFEKNKCQLLETEYNKTKMRYICECGKENSIVWNNFLQG